VWQQMLAEAGFEELEHYYRPTGLPRAQQPPASWRIFG
ncbi:MAG: SAM-dependent methyltransferase, partial [Pseudomonas sp.]